MTLDFTLRKYQELCDAISKSEYTPLTFENFISSDVKPENFIIIRHDVDSGPEYSLKMAIIEKEYGLTSTYYFRYIDDIFLPSLIGEIANLGHEIGYHYEVLDKAKGDCNKAIKIFEKEIIEFRRLYNVRTIAQHGSPLLGSLNATSASNIYEIFKYIIRHESIFTNWVNLDIWKKYDFKNFDVIGEAYLSLDFNETIYLSDTGRSWGSSKYKMKDFVKSNNSFKNLDIKSTDDIMNLIKNKRVNSLCILIHPIQWKENFDEWLRWIFFQQIRNYGKLALKWYFKHLK